MNELTPSRPRLQRGLRTCYTLVALILFVTRFITPAQAQDVPRVSTPKVSTPKLSPLLFVAAAALLPLDRGISEELGDSWPQHNGVLRASATGFNNLGVPGAPLLALATLGAGLVSGSPEVTDIGLHASEAVAVSSLATGLIKGIVGRSRPTEDLDADEFKLGGGFGGGGTSFPSGHTAAAFALATTVVDELKLHDPGAVRYAAPLAYGAASMVGLSRIYSQRHWSSDVLVGAVVGTYVSHKLFQHNHRKR